MTISDGYIFVCSNSTEDECIQRLLFGSKKPFPQEVDKLTEGTTLFLYNYTSQRLHGIFTATTTSQDNIEADAWNGKYPWQIKVDWKKQFNPLSKDKINEIVTFNNIYPYPVLKLEQVNALAKLFEDENYIPETVSRFRDKFPATHYCSDGHKVRSLGELTIDNWLFSQRIAHGYERKVPIVENMYCDFVIPVFDKASSIYVEYWGLEDERYLERRRQKEELYHRNNLHFISLTPDDLETLDDILPGKLRPFLAPEHKFY